MSTHTKTWETTREPNLLRNGHSGRYYARFRIAGKSKWINLKTDVFTVAVLRLGEEKAHVTRGRLTDKNVEGGVGTMGELADIYLKSVAANPNLQPKSKQRYGEMVAAVRKTWPGFDKLTPNRITRTVTKEWRDRVARDGTGFIVPGAKGRTKLADGSSPGTINKVIDAMRLMLEIAVERGQLGGNPLRGRGLKLKIKPRKPNLPEASILNALFENIENRGSGRSPSCGELCRFLAFTGCRISEAVAVRWQDVDFDRGILRVHGTKTESADREVPLIPAARSLLEKIRVQRLAELKLTAGEDATLAPDTKVLRVADASRSLTNACKDLGIEKLTHHDLRDAFTTSCIEAGVDIPTVASWLGHKDGGALLMRVYAHHRRAHSQAQAAKVIVGGES
jgi:integrase